MWMRENLDIVFLYQKHSMLELNSYTQSRNSFSSGILTEWQLEMMVKFGNNNALLIDETFETGQTWV